MDTPKDLLVKKDKYFIRFFMWVWEMEEESLDQCRVFWGLMAFPLGLAVKFCFKNAIMFVGGFFLAISFCLAGLTIVYNELLSLLLVSMGVGFVSLFLGYSYETVTLKEGCKAEKILNKLTIIGSMATKKIQAFLDLLFYVPIKIILFLLKPFEKPLLWLGKKGSEIINNDKTKGFFWFFINHTASYKKSHCRKIKLVE